MFFLGNQVFPCCSLFLARKSNQHGKLQIYVNYVSSESFIFMSAMEMVT